MTLFSWNFLKKMQNILLPYQNKIVAQLFLHSSEGAFRQHITRNVRILDNLNFFQPNHKRSSSIKGGLQSKVIFQQRLASIKDLLPVCCRMFQNVPIPPATFIISLEANCHIQTGGKIHLQGHKLLLYTKKEYHPLPVVVHQLPELEEVEGVGEAGGRDAQG